MVEEIFQLVSSPLRRTRRTLIGRVYCLFTGWHRPPINKTRDGWAVKLYKLLISRETYTSGERLVRNRSKVILVPELAASVQVVTGVFNKVNFKTPARWEINFNAGYRLSLTRNEPLLRTNVGNGCERT